MPLPSFAEAQAWNATLPPVAGFDAAARINAALKVGMRTRGAVPYGKKVLESDYRLWLSELLPKHFRSAGPDQFAPHHQRFFQWGWEIKKNVLPDMPACLWVVNRGGNKSTSVAGLAVALGAMGHRKFGLVITRTEPQGDTHIRRVNDMLLASKVGQIYPKMSKPSIQEVGKRTIQGAWNRTMLTTAAGWTLQNFSLLAAIRGVGVGEFRPDFLWITDVDDEHDTPGFVDTLLNALSASVISARSSDCVVIFDQNVIHRDSVLNRIITGKTDVLSDRVLIGPVPAVYEPEYERKEGHWHIRKGRSSWLDVKKWEADLNAVGMDSWEREYQHNVTLAYADAIYPQWEQDGLYHRVTWSEFARFFGKYGLDVWDDPENQTGPRLPKLKGKIVMAMDWGNNPDHPCALRWVWRPPEGMPLTDCVFFYREMCWPRFPLVEADDRSHPSALQVGEAILGVERAWDEGPRVMRRLSSHERPEICEALRTDMRMARLPILNFTQLKTAKARDGILHMQNFLALESKPHPFKVYPIGHAMEGKPFERSPRVFFLVADGQGEPYVDLAGQLRLNPPLDEAGQARTCFEYPNYRKPNTAQGAERRDPLKIDDDIVDCDRAIAGHFFPGVMALSLDEKVEAALPESLRKDILATMPEGHEKDIAAQGRYQQMWMARRDVEQVELERSGLNLYEQARAGL